MKKRTGPKPRPHPPGLLIDDADRHLIENRGVWISRAGGYPMVTCDGRNIKLHQAVIGRVSEGFEIDHKNRNKMDARRSNLRVVTKSVNRHNVQCYVTSKTGVGGVFRRNGRFGAQVKNAGKVTWLGTFDSIAEAAEYVRAFKLALGVWPL